MVDSSCFRNRKIVLCTFLKLNLTSIDIFCCTLLLLVDWIIKCIDLLKQDLVRVATHHILNESISAHLTVSNSRF